MKPRSPTADAGAAQCPECRAPIHAPASARRRRVQCPKCRAIVVLGKGATEGKAEESAVPQPEEVALLKARIEVLERAMEGMQQALVEATRGSKLRWIAAGTQPGFSELQAETLRDNLSVLPAHRITIEAPLGDSVARERAEWFKTIFTEARWSVSGPKDAPSCHIKHVGVSLATGLPVSAEAAATFLAVRAAGFEIGTIFDAELRGDEPRLVVA